MILFPIKPDKLLLSYNKKTLSTLKHNQILYPDAFLAKKNIEEHFDKMLISYIIGPGRRVVVGLGGAGQRPGPYLPGGPQVS